MREIALKVIRGQGKDAWLDFEMDLLGYLYVNFRPGNDVMKSAISYVRSEFQNKLQELHDCMVYILHKEQHLPDDQSLELADDFIWELGWSSKELVISLINFYKDNESYYRNPCREVY